LALTHALTGPHALTLTHTLARPHALTSGALLLLSLSDRRRLLRRDLLHNLCARPRRNLRVIRPLCHRDARGQRHCHYCRSDSD
jgi:hypothetical protein